MELFYFSAQACNVITVLLVACIAIRIVLWAVGRKGRRKHGE